MRCAFISCWRLVAGDVRGCDDAHAAFYVLIADKTSAGCQGVQAELSPSRIFFSFFRGTYFLLIETVFAMERDDAGTASSSGLPHGSRCARDEERTREERAQLGWCCMHATAHLPIIIVAHSCRAACLTRRLAGWVQSEIDISLEQST